MNYNRFDFGDEYKHIESLSDKELAKAIRDIDYCDPDLNRELVWRANDIEPGLFNRYVEAGKEDIGPIVEKAFKILNV